jgi:MFS family permease
VPTRFSVNLGKPATVFLLMLVVACAHFNRVGITVAGAERLIPEYGIEPDKMGLVYSAYLAIYTLAMLPGGLLIDHFGARRALVGLGFGSAVFVALTGGVGLAFAGAFAVWLGLMVVRALLGLVSAPLHPGGAHLVFEQVPSEGRSTANGLVTASACVGIAATYLVMGMLIDLFTWPVAFLISGAATLGVALLWTAGTRTPGAPGSRAAAGTGPFESPEGLWHVLRSRSVICITLSYAAFGYFQYMFFYWITYYFETIKHEDKSVARWYSTLITLAMGLGMMSGGWLADHVPRSLPLRARRAFVPVLGMIMGGVVFELGLLGNTAGTTLAAFAVSAALIGACEGAFWTTVVEVGGRFGGSAAGLMNTGGNAGGTLSPYLTPLLSGYFAEHYGADSGWRLGLALAGIVVVLGAALWWGVGPARDHAVRASEADHLMGDLEQS